jgi:hypothetical protein
MSARNALAREELDLRILAVLLVAVLHASLDVRSLFPALHCGTLSDAATIESF